jgi:hypothetical protein
MPRKKLKDYFRDDAGANGRHKAPPPTGKPITPAQLGEVKRSVRTLPPYQPFPVAELPPVILAFVQQGAQALGCDPAYLALPALAVVASAIGNTRTIRLKRGWDEPCVIWAALVGESGTLKSPAFVKAVGYLWRLQQQLIKEHKRAVAGYQDEAQAYREKKKRCKEEGGDPGDPPEEPVLRRVVCSDTTIEKLAEILEDNPRGILVARDELAGWLGSFARYKAKGAGSDLPNWLEMFRSGTIVVDRKTGDRRTLFIHRAAVSVTGSIQPGVLARALSLEFMDAGLAARLLMALPPRLPKKWTETEIYPEVEQAYETLVARLLKLEMTKDKEGEPAPFPVKLTPGAKGVWVTFYNEWAKEQAAAEGELAAAFSKLEAYAARFALLHHVVKHATIESDDCDSIQADSIQAGVRLCRWCAGEARRIYGTLSESTEEREQRRLVEFIQSRGGRITGRDLQRTNGRKYPTRDHAEAALDLLAQDSLGYWQEPASLPKSGHPARVLILHPTPDTSDTFASGGEHHSDNGADTSGRTGQNSNVSGRSVGRVGRRTEQMGDAEPDGDGEADGGAGGQEYEKGDAWEGD